MAQFTREALVKLREMFDNRKLILVNDKIYKRIKNKMKIEFKNEVITVEAPLLLKKYFHGVEMEKLSVNYQKAIVYLTNSISNGALYIDYNGLYKRYGSKDLRGYQKFYIEIDKIPYRTYEHRVIYYLYFNEWDDFKIIHHRDNHKSNNRIRNIDLVSRSENIVSAFEDGKISVTPAALVDRQIKRKYYLNDVDWEIYKKEAIKTFKDNGKEYYSLLNRDDKEIQRHEMKLKFEKFLCAIRDDQVCLQSSMVDDIFKKKYNLGNEEWEAFKDEVMQDSELYNR